MGWRGNTQDLLGHLLALPLWDSCGFWGLVLWYLSILRKEMAGVCVGDPVPGAGPFKGLVLLLLLFRVLPRSHDLPSAFAYVVGFI